ncbi:Crp/Fnr family transcriptional regulator [Flavobacterium pedocola]
MLNILTAINRYVNLMINDDDTNTAETNINLSTDSIVALMNSFKRLNLPKGHLLVKPNDICRDIYFVEKGAARIFYYKDDKDVTDGFRGDETLLLSMVSFIKQKPDKRGIELLDDCILWSISKNELEAICDKHPDVERLFRMVMSSAVIMGQNRIDLMLFQTAEERYADFIRTNKRAHELLTLGMIASFLGITQETLSRIRAKAK